MGAGVCKIQKIPEQKFKYPPSKVYTKPLRLGNFRELNRTQRVQKMRMRQINLDNPIRYEPYISEEDKRWNPNILIEQSGIQKLDNVNGVNILPLINLEGINIDNTQILDDFLRKNQSRNFIDNIISFLKSIKLDLRIEKSSLCGDVLRFIPEGVYFNHDSKFNKLKDNEFISNLSKNNKKQLVNSWGSTRQHVGKRILIEIVSETDIELLKQKINERFILLPTFEEQFYKDIKGIVSMLKAQLETIKKELFECSNQYYLVSLSTIVLFNNYGHQNFLIFDKVNEIVIYIDPQYYGYRTEIGRYLTAQQNLILTKVLERLGIPEYNKVLPYTPFPQSIANDENCMFWTFLVTICFLLNPNTTSPDEIADAITTKYPDRESLLKYIESFKEILARFLLKNKKAGKRRRRTYRKKLI
jgi:hypothetical protein